MARVRKNFCVECRSEEGFILREKDYVKYIKDRSYNFTIYEAVCEKCGEPMNIPGLMDRNTEEIDRQYRLKEGIVSIDDINNLMSLYKLGKAPLSLALGFGEITITRYLLGQVPSKEYSNIIKKALESPKYMIEMLDENLDKIGEAAYKKAKKAAKELEPLFSLSEKMLLAISYIFKRVEEVTPLALQKMLYYIQGIYMIKYDTPIFEEECQAWAHGPVYRDVYEVFKSFKYNPIDDTRFAMLQNRFNELSDKEKNIIDMVVDSFGMYSGKILEKITHLETPWIEARAYCLPDEVSNEIITKDSIKEYFLGVSKEYDFNHIDGIKKYINSKLEQI